MLPVIISCEEISIRFVRLYPLVLTGQVRVIYINFHLQNWWHSMAFLLHSIMEATVRYNYMLCHLCCSLYVKKVTDDSFNMRIKQKKDEVSLIKQSFNYSVCKSQNLLNIFFIQYAKLDNWISAALSVQVKFTMYHDNSCCCSWVVCRRHASFWKYGHLLMLLRLLRGWCMFNYLHLTYTESSCDLQKSACHVKQTYLYVKKKNVHG